MLWNVLLSALSTDDDLLMGRYPGREMRSQYIHLTMSDWLWYPRRKLVIGNVTIPIPSGARNKLPTRKARMIPPIVRSLKPACNFVNLILREGRGLTTLMIFLKFPAHRTSQSESQLTATEVWEVRRITGKLGYLGSGMSLLASFAKNEKLFVYFINSFCSHGKVFHYLFRSHSLVDWSHASTCSHCKLNFRVSVWSYVGISVRSIPRCIFVKDRFLMKMIKRLVTLWCSPRISNSLLVPLLLTQTLFPFLHEHTLL